MYDFVLCPSIISSVWMKHHSSLGRAYCVIWPPPVSETILPLTIAPFVFEYIIPSTKSFPASGEMALSIVSFASWKVHTGWYVSLTYGLASSNLISRRVKTPIVPSVPAKAINNSFSSASPFGPTSLIVPSPSTHSTLSIVASRNPYLKLLLSPAEPENPPPTVIPMPLLVFYFH